MSRKTTIDALFAVKPAAIPSLGAPNTPPPAAVEPHVVRTGAVAAIGATLQQWSEAARSAADLQARMAGAQTLLELDPALIEPAPVRDRLPVEDDRSLLALKLSIRENGQQVPILVRPHPVRPGHFQAAYGHRRLMVCAELGLKVRAVVSTLSDEDLVLAQGRENNERRDLSFIETALFAHRLEAAGYSRALVIASLGIDKSDVSRFIGIAKSIPEALVRLIGPAPKAGRARWTALAEAVRLPSGRAGAERAILQPAFIDAETDQRFALVLGAARQTVKLATEPENRLLVSDKSGRPVVWLQNSAKTAQIQIDSTIAPGLAAFVAAQLPVLYQRYEAGEGRAAAIGPRLRQLGPRE